MKTGSLSRSLAIIWEAIELEAEQQEAQLFILVQDLQGGQTVAGPFIVPLSK